MPVFAVETWNIALIAEIAEMKNPGRRYYKEGLVVVSRPAKRGKVFNTIFSYSE